MHEQKHRITNRSVSLAVELYMRVGIYVRVSTRDQNCAMQLRDLRAYCTARQPDVVREYVFDAGQSGRRIRARN